VYFLIRFSVLFLLLVGAPIVRAQAPPARVDRDAERVQERERERLRLREEDFRRQQTVAPQSLPVPLADEAPVETGACTAIRQVVISGVTLFRQADFAGERASLVGGCVSIDQINAVLRAITNRYIGRGYVTSRAVVAPQKTDAGELEILVIEGRLNAIKGKSQPSARGYSRGELATAFPGIRGNILNLRDLEQGVDQLSRLSSAEPDIDIAPAPQPGQSDLIVNRKRAASPVRAGLAVNNDGSASTGRHQSTVSIDADSPLGFGDFWSLYYARAIEARRDIGSEGFGAFVSFPFGYSSLTVSAGRYRYESVLQAIDQAFSSTGSSVNGSIALDRLVFRDARTKASVAIGLSVLDTENRIQGLRLSTSSYRLVNGTINVRVQRRIGRGLANLDLGFTRGLSLFGAQAVDTGAGGPAVTFRKIDASLEYQEPLDLFGASASYSGQVRAAAAIDPVFPAERFSLGGSPTVRGFRDDGISGRAGVFARQQIGINVARATVAGLDTGISCVVGYDAGGIIPRDDDAFERGFIHSSTVGLRVSNRHLQGEMTVSAPLSAPESVARRRYEVLASLRLSLQ
jgi:hemolysin activation/secretion protein